MIFKLKVKLICVYIIQVIRVSMYDLISLPFIQGIFYIIFLLLRDKLSIARPLDTVAFIAIAVPASPSPSPQIDW